MYNTRVEYKRKMLEVKQEYENTKDKKLLKDISKYNNIQMSQKISLNSAYGAIGNAYFRYHNLLIAEGITTSGQLSIQAGLSLILIGISIRFVELLKKTMLLQVIQDLGVLHLTDMLVKSLNLNQTTTSINHQRLDRFAKDRD